MIFRTVFAGVLAYWYVASPGELTNGVNRTREAGNPGRSSPDTGTSAFLDVNVVPMDAERILTGQTVVVQGNRILAIGPSKKIRVPRNAIRISAKGKYLIPGLADMHTHLQLADSAEAERWLRLFLANGVTTIRNMDYLTPSEGLIRQGGSQLTRWRARTASGEIPGPHIYTSGPVDGVWDQILRGLRLPPDSMEHRLAKYKAAGYDFLKVYPEERTATFDSLLVIARRVGIPVVGHITANSPIDTSLFPLYTSIEHLFGFSYNRKSPITDEEIPAIVAATRRGRVWICPTQMLAEMISNRSATDAAKGWPEVRGAYVSDELQQMWWGIVTINTSDHDAVQKITTARRLLKALQDAGAGLLLGTDAPAHYQVPGFSVHHELEALVRAGLTPYQALLTGTRNVAEYFGTSQDRGTVTVGKQADLVLLNGNPLTNIRNTASPVGVMIGGRWLPNDATATTVQSRK